MCGISGFIDSRVPAERRLAAVNAMCAAMLHRGPDDVGIETQGAATLGMRRLAIFDPAHGHQPMSTPDGRFHLLFNGAIYNHRELRAELAALGFAFRTACDTEVLLAAFAHRGESCLGRLRGMFAFAVWDAREESLFLARDPFGIKPLYYHHEGSRLVFASELRALFAGGAASPEIDPQAVADYLAWFAVPAPRTIYRGISSLQPGECARFRAGELTLRRAWDFRSIPRASRVCASREEFIGELRTKLEDSIRAHTVADVPVGAFLSGGLDSSVVVGLMARTSAGRLKTFSIAFAEAEFSEAAEAEASARHFGTEHVTRLLRGGEVAADLPAILGALDQPTGDGINTYYASETARRGGVTVALSGLGGDELFGGYPSFHDIPKLARWLPFWRALPRFARAPVLARLRARGARPRKLADLLEHGGDLHELASLYRTVLSQPARRALLSGDARAALDGSRPHHPALGGMRDDLARAGAFEIVSGWELRTYMADLLLRDSDVMSMRHSLELRVPFVDRELIEWLWQQPVRFRASRAHPKDALADAVADLLPAGLHARRKRGFTLPFGGWMRKELRPFLDETFSAASTARSGLFNAPAVQQLWRDYLAGDDSRQWSRVWSLAVLVHFINHPPLAQPA